MFGAKGEVHEFMTDGMLLPRSRHASSHRYQRPAAEHPTVSLRPQMLNEMQ